MRDERETPTPVRDRQWSADWPEWPGGALVAAPARPIAVVRRTRTTLAGATALVILAVAAWGWSSRVTTPVTGSPALWNVELTSAGPQPVTALVFGDEAGIHLVRLPAAGTPSNQRRHVPVRLGQGNVYMVSLGRNRLDIAAQSPPGVTPMSLSAEGRFLKLLQNREVTGVRTGWW